MVVTIIEIVLCLPVYYALMRWAPQLIGLTKRKAAVLIPPALQNTGA